jgi:hypothetical protein
MNVEDDLFMRWALEKKGLLNIQVHGKCFISIHCSGAIFHQQLLTDSKCSVSCLSLPEYWGIDSEESNGCFSCCLPQLS